MSASVTTRGRQGHSKHRRSNSCVRLTMSSTTVNLKVVLLDDAEIEIAVQQRLLTSDFRDIVTSQVNIRETQYFGLSYIDENGYKHWLQEDRRVLDHDFPRRSGVNQKPLLLYLGIKFYVDSISYLVNSITYEQFYLQSRKLIAKGDLECDSETVFYLGALTMQITHGDFVEPSEARAKLRKMPVLPLRTLKQHPSLDYCEGKVVDHYQTMVGMMKGDAMLEYLEMIQRLPSYGVQFFEVKSSSGIPWWLGIGNVGISIYDHNDRRTPRETFSWERIENFFYRDKKFSLIVFDPKRVVHTLSAFHPYDSSTMSASYNATLEEASTGRQHEADELALAMNDPTTLISSSRRSFIPGNTKTHVWHAITAALAKTIYSMAESTKHFCLDNAERHRAKSETPRPPPRNDVAYEITHRRHSFCRPVHSASLVRPQQGSAVTLDRHRSIHPLTSASHTSRSYGSLHTASSGLLNASVASGSDTGISTSMLEELASQQHLQDHHSEVFDKSVMDTPAQDSKTDELTDEEKEKVFQAMKEKYDQLEDRKQGLLKLFEQKLEQLKAICMEEGELTGELPEEYPCRPNEKLPTVRKRIGATFALSPLLIHSPQTPSNAGDITPQLPHRSFRNSDTSISGVGVISVDGLSGMSPNDEAGSNLSLEYELQKQIVSAQTRLAQERGATKSVRRQRKDDLKKAREKLRQMEIRINGTRKCSLDSSMFGLSLTASSRGSLDEQISEGQLSLTGSSNEMLDSSQGHQVNPYNTVSGVPAYMSPNVNARRRVFGHSRGSLPEFSCPSVSSVPSGTADSSYPEEHEFRRDSYASQKSLPVATSRQSRYPLPPSHRRHNRSHHCSPARARPAVGAHLDDAPSIPVAPGDALSPDQACDSGFVSLHTPSNSQRHLISRSQRSSAAMGHSEEAAVPGEGMELSPNTQRRNLLYYRTRYPYPHHFSNSDSQLSAATGTVGDEQTLGPTGTLKTNYPSEDKSARQPQQFWYQPPQGNLDFVSTGGENQGQTKNFWYVPPSQLETLEPVDAAAPHFTHPSSVEFEKPLETADCLQYSEETRRRLAAAQRSGRALGVSPAPTPSSVASGSGSDLDRRYGKRDFESVAEDFSSEMFSWFDSQNKGTYV